MTEDQSEYKAEGGIYRKLLEITEEAEKIPKNGYNEFSKYNYVKAVDALGAIRKLLIKHGVHLTISELGCKRYRDGKNFHTEIEAKATFIDIDTGDYHSTTFFSVSADTLDKDIFKAKTNGLKYLFTQEFKLVTDDFVDVEQGGEHEKPPEPITENQIDKIDELKKEAKINTAEKEIKFKNRLQQLYKTPAIDRLDTNRADDLIKSMEEGIKFQANQKKEKQ